MRHLPSLQKWAKPRRRATLSGHRGTLDPEAGDRVGLEFDRGDPSEQETRRRGMSTRENVQAVIDGILKGDILGTFDRWYADDVVMSENGVDERVGKAANRAYEEAFVNGVEFHGAEVGLVVVDGDYAAIEWSFDLTPKGGERMAQKQVALQTWKEGKVIREVFYHG
jgi:hypothetical protein